MLRAHRAAQQLKSPIQDHIASPALHSIREIPELLPADHGMQRAQPLAHLQVASPPLKHSGGHQQHAEQFQVGRAPGSPTPTLEDGGLDVAQLQLSKHSVTHGTASPPTPGGSPNAGNPHLPELPQKPHGLLGSISPSLKHMDSDQQEPQMLQQQARLGLFAPLAQALRGVKPRRMRLVRLLHSLLSPPSWPLRQRHAVGLNGLQGSFSGLLGVGSGLQVGFKSELGLGLGLGLGLLGVSSGL